MSSPYRCPVCQGRCTMPQSFYLVINTGSTLMSGGVETCRSCGGRGIVWGPNEPPTQPAPTSPQPFNPNGGITFFIPPALGVVPVSGNTTGDVQ